MPPRRSARAAAAAERRRSLVESLPLTLTQRVLSLLPLDARGRAACVCRTWRDALEAPDMWSRLDLSSLDAVQRYRAKKEPYSLFVAAAGRAKGQLRYMDIACLGDRLPSEVLLRVLAENAGLRELRLDAVHISDDQTADEARSRNTPALAEILAAAPLLQVVETAGGMSCPWNRASLLFRVPLLRIGQLSVDFYNEDQLGLPNDVEAFTAELADTAVQPSLSQLIFQGADISVPQTFDAFVSVALARQLSSLDLIGTPPPPAAPLARLIREGSLKKLLISHTHMDDQTHERAPLFDADGAALVAGALRASTTIQDVTLFASGLRNDDGEADIVFGALVGHPSLRKLTVLCESGVAPVERGAALAALVAADAPALDTLTVYCYHTEDDCTCALGDGGLLPIMRALPRNRHLRVLNIQQNDMSERFARGRLLPALRANTGLRQLWCDGDDYDSDSDIDRDDGDKWPAVEEMQGLLQKRWEVDCEAQL